ncbi:MAG: acylphosphatase [Leptolyngbyaceae cyanobacterium bins.302]|nr:acylphosphatase [Leptolyngbyaceae cyanobacterium bins.302]
MMELIRAHVLIAGRVQRVGFRFSTQDMATLYGLTGWVQNLADGRVEAVFEGDRASVEEMIHWCHKGPPHAQVDEVVVNYEHPQGLKGFEIRRGR